MRQVIVIALAILGMGVLIAISVGLALGLRSTVKKPEAPIVKPPAVISNPPSPSSHPDNEDHPQPKYRPPNKRSGKYRMTAVQARDEVCAEIGMDVIVRGGSAVDSAVATMFCLGTTQFQSSGIGGGHFMTVYDSERGTNNKTMTTLLSREVLPLAGYKEYYLNHSSLIGGSAVGVPSTLHGLYTAWRMYGRVPWRHLVTPSIKLCEGGFKVHKTLQTAIDRKKKHILETNNINLRNVIQKPDGTFYEEGDIMKRPLFARTLKIIADDPMSFYNGSLADDIVADIQEAGGEITKEDLMRYQTRIRKPVSGRLKSLGLTMYAPEPPSSGVVLEYILRLCDGFGFSNESLKDPTSILETYQKIVEVYKFAFGRRSALADPLFWNISQVMGSMSDDTDIDRIRSKIDTARTHNIDYYEHLFQIVDDAGTSHISVLAPDGGAVSLSASVNYYFGSEVYGSRTGILFNNEMDDFSIPGKTNVYNITASPSNFPEPGKMPMSSMSPIIFLTDSGEVAYISGASGGPRIISSIAYVVLHNLYLGMDLKSAIDSRRLHHQLLPNHIRYEDGFDQDILEGLKGLNHKLVKVAENGNVGAIRNLCAYGCTPGDGECMETCVHAVADLRKDGSVYGY